MFFYHRLIILSISPMYTRCTSMKWRFEKQMAHQCSVKYKDLTLYAILLYHQQVSKWHAQNDLIWLKSLHSIVFMTKFVPNKEHSRTALIFCFHLKKTVTESYRLLGEAYGEHAPYFPLLFAPRKKRVNDGFSVSKLEISMLQTRNTENRPKSRRGIASIAGWRWFTNTKTTRRAIER